MQYFKTRKHSIRMRIPRLPYPVTLFAGGSLSRGSSPSSFQGGSLSREGTWDQRYPTPTPEGAWDQRYSTTPVDRQTPETTLPSCHFASER